MSRNDQLAERWSTMLAATASIVLGLALLALAVEVAAGDPPPTPVTAVGASVDGRVDGAAAPLAIAEDLRPTSLHVPAIDVDANVTELGLTEDGAMEVPRGEVYDLPGWYVHGPRPGELGPAVLGGHVDSRSGPSVFHRLGGLEPGDLVEVGYGDGTVARFTVERTERHPKDEFPFDEVFGNTSVPALRLITCGGAFDHGSRSYDDNIVVFAILEGAGSSPQRPARTPQGPARTPLGPA